VLFRSSLTPSGEIAGSLSGDCTEYAVLLAALIRSEGIPARVVVGFVYLTNPESFVPHMWTEARIDGVWLPLDVTLAKGIVGLTHLKVADSALSDDIGSGPVLFIPLLDFLGRATVESVPQETP